MNDELELFTDRLCLREIKEEDATIIVDLRSDPNIYRFFKAPYAITLEEHFKWFHECYLYNSDRIDWIAQTNDNKVIGVFGIKRENAENPNVELSYILVPSEYKKGYATEAIKRIMEFCRDEWKCKYVVAEIHVNNINSIRFIEKMEFVKVEDKGCFKVYRSFLYNLNIRNSEKEG